MILDTILDFEENRITVKEVVITSLIDEFNLLYKEGKLDANEQIECLGFINSLFRLKHKFILDFNKERRSFSRDMQMFHLKKLQRLVKLRIKMIPVERIPRKKYESSEEVIEFKSLIASLNKKMKSDISKKTKMLLDELMRERWTVKDKSDMLLRILGSKDAKFGDMLESKDVEEIITSFLALLDMKRKNAVDVIQEENFGEILIKQIKSSAY